MSRKSASSSNTSSTPSSTTVGPAEGGFVYPGKLPVVGVMGSGTETRHPAMAKRLARGLARLGVNLLTGGGRGTMETVCRAFCETQGRTGRTLGIIPARNPLQGGHEPRPGYPNPWIEIPIFTHLSAEEGPAGQDSRNHINVLSADVVIALSGGAGTRAEIDLALYYGKPAFALLGPSPDDPEIPAGSIGGKALPHGIAEPEPGEYGVTAALTFCRRALAQAGFEAFD